MESSPLGKEKQMDNIRAWKDPAYRATLSPAERAELASPVGMIELTGTELDQVSGGGGCGCGSHGSGKSHSGKSHSGKSGKSHSGKSHSGKSHGSGKSC